MPTHRPATTTDIDRLVTLEQASGVAERSADAYAKELELAWSRVLVIDTHDAGVVGVAVTWLVEGEAELHWITVHPEHRQRGLAGALLHTVIDDMRSRGARRLLLEVRRSNTPARALYKSCGFAEIGVRKGYYQRDNEDALIMELLIEGAA